MEANRSSLTVWGRFNRALRAWSQRQCGAAAGQRPEWMRRGLGRLRQRLRTQPRQLRIRETVSLGDRRFVALLECDQQRFLVGGTSTQINLLARLGASAAPSGEEVESLGAETTLLQ